MKRITKIEDMMGGARNGCEMGKDFIFSGEMIKNGIVVLPADSPVDGTFGCIVFEKENDKNSLTYSRRVYDSCDLIPCVNGEEFFDELQKSLDSNYPTFICDQPKILKVGFVSLRNDGNKFYSLGIAAYKEYLDSKK